MRDFHFSIDRGGTFTDVFAEVPDGKGGSKFRVLKLLSVDPANYPDAPREGIRRVLEEVTGLPHPRQLPLDTSRIASIRMGTTVATNALLERQGERVALAVTEGFPDLLHIANQLPLDTSRIASIRMGTTVATNALLERQGERVALAVTEGFPDLLHIANQSRPAIFDLEIRSPEPLYEEVLEVEEQVVLPLGGEPGSRNGAQAELNRSRYPPQGTLATAVTGEEVEVRRDLNEARLREGLRGVLSRGIRSLAVVLKHAAIYPEHERRVGAIARELGFTQVSLSHEVMPMVKMVPRGFTAAADAYLTPHIRRYIADFTAGFDEGLRDVQVLFMQSDGGLSPVDQFSGHKAILSGPAGGYVGYALTTRWPGAELGKLQVIGFDMGGTSTDVSRYAGSYEHVFETTTAGVTIQAPQLDINTVAAGGGSRLVFRGGLFVVGPESVGAHPGPVCYKKGGQLAITDANLQLGRILPEFFPKARRQGGWVAGGGGGAFEIFGPKENEPLDAEGTAAAFAAVTAQVNAFEEASGAPSRSTPDEVAVGFIRVANEAMCRPIRALTQMRGYDAARHVLGCFGGAGGQHACAIAAALGMSTIFVHRYAGVLSAVGIHLADVVAELQEPAAALLGPGGPAPELLERQARLEAAAVAKLMEQGFQRSQISTERFLNLRYAGTDVAVMTQEPQPAAAGAAGGGGGGPAAYGDAFAAAYRREFGFVLDRAVWVDDVRVRAVGRARPLPEEADAEARDPGPLPPPLATTSAFFEPLGRQPTPAYGLDSLSPGHSLPGPALLIDAISTVVVEPGWRAVITPGHNIRMEAVTQEAAALEEGRGGGAGADGRAAVAEQEGAAAEEAAVAAAERDPVRLAIFSHRFMGIAEQMGRTLQRTSVSVNIKERLDFSCALFGPDGSLVANAPHLPVHLGAMAEAVRFQIGYYSPGGPGGSEGLLPGDVLLSNHPQLAGGSHLPDITVITPVFEPEPEAGAEGEPRLGAPGRRVVFFVASRGHHADIGGISPGSMPPTSRLLVEEGAAVVSFKIVRGGVFQEEGITQLLLAPGQLADRIPGCSGTRNLADNLSDLKAQVAANTRGIQLVGELIREYGLRTVAAFMAAIQRNAERSVRAMLREFSLKQGLPEVGTVTARDQMDDGSPICLAVTIDRRDGSATFDFAGTGPEVFANHNAPPAVTYSAIIYSLRCMVASDIPLNQGCLAPIVVRIPPGSILNPSDTAAVVGGNVLTSQRVTDVVLRAFSAAAASQGCMNNFTFGDEQMGYYETIAGGAGAGPGWNGRSGVHTHMTNTRITDPEILERRYPVVLHAFRLRPGSGGGGCWRGGDGVVREVEALRPLTAGILSERRAVRPFGLLGGGDAEPGLNLLIRREGRTVNIGAKATVRLEAGDRLRICTPGGGGYGPEGADADTARRLKRKRVGGGVGVGGADDGVDGEREGEGRRVALKGSLEEYRSRQETV
ncbi:hypothetical protein GPECTOR_1g189 [Gonium pectorale]|uniref:5-oxoprolinase n=1 Tax=Gonium pectorale TaxID=33097 RepID=A0A150H238_GONPE|nr:hypothetical protein GPECTOR_1g189 [Gonium pectorale]|eukprot:KXZ56217.1 hypothetical protein GPECTOR_1g189 [Gonium pectorale]